MAWIFKILFAEVLLVSWVNRLPCGTLRIAWILFSIGRNDC